MIIMDQIIKNKKTDITNRYNEKYLKVFLLIYFKNKCIPIYVPRKLLKKATSDK